MSDTHLQRLFQRCDCVELFIVLSRRNSEPWIWSADATRRLHETSIPSELKTDWNEPRECFANCGNFTPKSVATNQVQAVTCFLA